MAVPRCTGSKEPVRRPIDPVGGHRPHQSLGLGAPTEVDELVSASGAIMTPQGGARFRGSLALSRGTAEVRGLRCRVGY